MQTRPPKKATRKNVPAQAASPSGAPLPHERDEAPNPGTAQPQEVVRQAFKDIESGQEDTDLHDQRTQERTARKP